MKWIRDIVIVARHELSDAVSSRRAALVLILYVAGALLVCNGFISALHKIEIELSKLLALPPSALPGSVMNALWTSEQFRTMMIQLVGEKAVVSQLMEVHPMALVYGWLAFTFTPLLVMLISSPRISEELGSGSIRFVLARTSRPAWCLGKYVGQVLMVLVALTLSGLAAWCLMRFRLLGMDNLAVAQGMVIYSWKAWIYSLAFMGLALGISQVTSSQNRAMCVGFAAWIAISVLGLAARHLAGGGVRQIWHAIRLLLPMGHRLDLWRVDLAHQLPAAAFLLALGLLYLFIGHAVLSRRDL